MGATGSTTATFGSFPGSDTASVAITGQAGIAAGSHVEAWLDPTQTATADHSPDEHITAKQDTEVTCSALVAGTGFTINIVSLNIAHYGAYNVSWVWV
jgi:hypothetical protein